MAGFAELELGIYRSQESRFALRYRFWEPGSLVENNLGGDQPFQITLDHDQLSGALLNPEKYGKLLWEQLFANPAALNGFTRARVIAGARKASLRLRMYIEPAAAELHSLRWETLFDPDRQTWLCTDENLLFSRFLSSASLQPFEPPSLDRLRALVMIANPADIAEYSLDPVDVEGELERAKAGLADMQLTLLTNRGKASLENLLDGLRDGCEILYLVAHGGKVKNNHFVFLEKPDGKTQVVSVDELIHRLGELRQLPLLAVLISCQSAGATSAEAVQIALGPRLAEIGVPAVLAMQGKVTFPTMAEFMPTFFRELQRDGVIDRSLTVARGRVRNRLDWWMPVLFSRLRDNRLFLPSPAAQPLTLQFYEPETIYIPAGKFWMGRDPGPGVAGWEIPCHEVAIPAYRIGKYPVTNRQYAEYIRQTGEAVNSEMGWEGQSPPKERLNHPVTGISWYQARSYCEWLSRKTGRHYNLPDEAQWEKACRGTQGWLYPWGNEWQEGRCNSDAAQITPVDLYPPQSPYGCCDMVGNVREWTRSLWGEKRSEPDPRYGYPWADDGRNDLNENSLVRRIFRGGVADKPEEMTCTSRNGFIPDKPGLPGKRHGFRVMMELDARDPDRPGNFPAA